MGYNVKIGLLIFSVCTGLSAQELPKSFSNTRPDQKNTESCAATRQISPEAAVCFLKESFEIIYLIETN